jgi:hypothetical protein
VQMTFRLYGVVPQSDENARIEAQCTDEGACSIQRQCIDRFTVFRSYDLMMYGMSG